MQIFTEMHKYVTQTYGSYKTRTYKCEAYNMYILLHEFMAPDLFLG